MGFKLSNTSTTRNKTSSYQKSRLTALLEKEMTFFSTTFSNKVKETFYTELSVFLNAGITLKDALTLIVENQKKEKHRLFYESLLTKLISGDNISEIARVNKEFTEYEYYSLKIGEESGTIAEIVTELGVFFSGKNEQRRNLINALTYPMIIISTAIIVLVFLLQTVVPMFEDVFSQNQVELPTITIIIIKISNFIGKYVWWIGLVLAILFIFRKKITEQKWFKHRKDYLILDLPYIGDFVKAVYLAQFTQAVTLLISSKVSVLTSLELVGRMINFYPLRDALDIVEKNILEGKGLSDSLRGTKIFDNSMISLIKVAEETNQTEFVFNRLNQQYNIEIKHKAKLLSTIMEPLIILVMGILVGVILVAMYLPMFKLGSVLG